MDGQQRVHASSACQGIRPAVVVGAVVLAVAVCGCSRWAQGHSGASGRTHETGTRGSSALQPTGALYVLDTSSGKATELVEPGCPVGRPSWSPDGARIAYVPADADHRSRELVLADPSGAQPSERLSVPDVEMGQVEWSPDGRWLACRGSVPGDDRGRIVLVTPSGLPGPSVALEWRPSYVFWYPGSDRLLLGLALRLYSWRVGDEVPRRLTEGEHDESMATVSPAGDAVALLRGKGDVLQLWVVEGEGGRERQITRIPRGCLLIWPSWSPDGSRLAFGAIGSSGAPSVFSVKTDCSDLRQLTDGSHQVRNVAWSPGGGLVAYVAERQGQWDLWLMNSDGTGQVQVTCNPEREGIAGWSPDGSKLLVLQAEP